MNFLVARDYWFKQPPLKRYSAVKGYFFKMAWNQAGPAGPPGGWAPPYGYGPPAGFGGWGGPRPPGPRGPPPGFGGGMQQRPYGWGPYGGNGPVSS